MAVNHKLTSIIKGRVVRASEADSSGVQITFNDSSSMKVKTAGSQAPTIPERGSGAGGLGAWYGVCYRV